MNTITKFIKKTIAYIMMLAMMFASTSGLFAQAPTGQTRALFFNATNGTMYLWDGKVGGKDAYIGTPPTAATTVATTANFSGSYSWNSSTRTLTLNNFHYSTSHLYALYINAQLTIELIGDNSLTSTVNVTTPDISAALYFRPPSAYNVTNYITGSGTLDVRAGDVGLYRSSGINAYWHLRIQNGTINAYGGRGLISNGIFVEELLTINGGIINAHGGRSVSDGPTRGESTGISAEKGLTMTNGKIYATADSANVYSSGFWSYSGPINISGGIFVSRGHKGAVYANHNVNPPGSNIIFPGAGYVVWYNEDYYYEPIDADQINSADYRQSLSHRYVKFINYGIGDITPPIWLEGQETSLTPPTVFSGGRDVKNERWQISSNGITGWADWAVPGNALKAMDSMFIRYTVWMEYIENIYTNVVMMRVIPNQFTVMASDGGTVSGDTTGRYWWQTPINVVAMADEGYDFTGWTIAGVEIPGGNSANPANFNMPLNPVTLVANFAIKIYTIEISADPSTGGSVTGGGRYTHGTNVTVTATPNVGYNFVEWKEGGTVIPNADESFQFIATDNRNLVAHFELKKYNVTVRPNNPAYGVVNIEGGFYGPFDHGTTLDIMAVTTLDYIFVNWTEYGNGAIVSEVPNFTYTVTKNVNLIANFMPKDRYFVNLVVNPEGAGTVPNSRYYIDGTNITVTTTPNTGYDFVSWTIGGVVVSGVPSYNFNVTEDVTLVANYMLKTYTVAVSAKPAEGGNVTGGGLYEYGTSIAVTAIPTEGYDFVDWTENGASVSGDASYQFIITDHRNLVANFVLKTYRVTVRANNPVYGVVTGGGSSIAHGTDIPITASTTLDYVFVNWTELATGAIVSDIPNFIYSVEKNVDLVANFMPKDRYFVNLVETPERSGKTTGSGYYTQGNDVLIMATPAIGYNFVMWTKDGERVTTNLAYQFTVEENVTFVAHFTPIRCTVSVSANPLDGGTVTGDGIYDYGDNITVTAIPNPGWEFTSWTKNGVQVSTVARYTFTTIEDVALVANFTPIIYTIIIIVNNSEYGEIDKGDGIIYIGHYSYGQEISVVASPKATYHQFVKWTDESGGAIISSGSIMAGTEELVGPNYTFNITKNTVLTAHFKIADPDIIVVTVLVYPEGSGTVKGNNIFTRTPHQNASFIADANPGYYFDYWRLRADPIQHQDTNGYVLSFEVDQDVTLVAIFKQINYTVTVIANPEEGGSVTGEGTYHRGDEATVTAIVKAGYTFVNWTMGGTQISTMPSITFNPLGDIELVANFDLITYPVTFYVIGGNGGLMATANSRTQIISGTFVEHGSQVVLTAFPQDGHMIKSWTLAGAGDGNFIDNTLIIDSISGPIRVTVEFIGDNIDIDIGVGPGISVDPDPDGEDGLSFIAFAPCGENSALVIVTPKDTNARIFINGVEENPRTVDLPVYGNNLVDILVIAPSGTEQTYTLKINKLVPFWDMVVMRWNNTLSIINNPDNFPALNSNYFRANSYRWFADGQLFSINQWYSAGPQSNNVLNDTWEYVAQGTTMSGNLLRTCPQYISLVSLNVKAHPNPVSVGETLYVEADVDESLLKGAIIVVYGQAGNHIDTIKVRGRFTPINIRYSTGLHVFVLKSPTGFKQELKIVVQ
ncbi:MAG: InlB B-repeat-containing protein [Bacteroidales bacterium]|nr:InlB B-repeat-containing protein [Bacteroidales bacterium]